MSVTFFLNIFFALPVVYTLTIGEEEKIQTSDESIAITLKILRKVYFSIHVQIQ
jgi:hypothetical protein